MVGGAVVRIIALLIELTAGFGLFYVQSVTPAPASAGAAALIAWGVWSARRTPDVILSQAPNGDVVVTARFHTDASRRNLRLNSPGRIETAEVYGRWMSPTPLPVLPARNQTWDKAGSTVSLGSAVLAQR